MMRVSLWFAVVIALMSQTTLAKEYKSRFGFSYELSDDWGVLKQKDVKTRFKGSNFSDFGLAHLNKERAVAVLKSITSKGFL